VIPRGVQIMQIFWSVTTIASLFAIIFLMTRD
jgi:hypothetical protein